VRVELLSERGKVTSSSSQPCIMRFKSQPIRVAAERHSMSGVRMLFSQHHKVHMGGLCVSLVDLGIIAWFVIGRRKSI
jgi:hypothetical protein